MPTTHAFVVVRLLVCLPNHDLPPITDRVLLRLKRVSFTSTMATVQALPPKLQKCILDYVEQEGSWGDILNLACLKAFRLSALERIYGVITVGADRHPDKDQQLLSILASTIDPNRRFFKAQEPHLTCHVESFTLIVHGWMLNRDVYMLLAMTLIALSSCVHLEVLKVARQDCCVDVEESVEIVRILESLTFPALKTFRSEAFHVEAFYKFLQRNPSIRQWSHRSGDTERPDEYPYPTPIPETALPKAYIMEVDATVFICLRRMPPLRTLKIFYHDDFYQDDTEDQVLHLLRYCSDTLVTLSYDRPSRLDSHKGPLHLLRKIAEAAPKLEVLSIFDGRWSLQSAKDATMSVAESWPRSPTSRF